MDGLSLGLVGVACVLLAGAAWLAARWRIEAHGVRVPGPVSQLELRVARRAGEARGWRLYCSIVVARGTDRPILSGQPPAQGL
ncbi:hypothetical protein [Rhodoblastus acidophilus]|nr:hypothetical protein [Rhodoblastus acidophilus]